MCSNAVQEFINQLESGQMPYPIFFGGTQCTGGRWPLLPLTEADLKRNKVWKNTDICPANTFQACPVPMVLSMIFPPNIKIYMEAMSKAHERNNPSTIDVSTLIKELGALQMVANEICVNNVCQDMNNEAFQMGSNDGRVWASRECTDPGKKNCFIDSVENKQSNCKYTPGYEYDNTDNKMLASLVSCGSPFIFSFSNVTANNYNPENAFKTGKWATCGELMHTLQPDTHKDRSTCMINVPPKGSKPGTAIENIISNSLVKDECSHNIIGLQTCACLASLQTARHIGAPTSSDCGNLMCRTCKYKWPLDSTQRCVCQGTPKVYGSVESFTIELINKYGNNVDWETLQGEYCTDGLIVSNISIQRYGNGTPTCDTIMPRLCSDSALLLAENDLSVQCQCINESKRLRAQFAGIDLPSHCFTTVCDITNEKVYKTAEQLAGCSARLCNQTLSIHGNFIIAQGFQQIICDGQIYNLTDLPPAQEVPFVSQVQSNSEKIEFGTLFYISLGFLLMIIILIIVWSIRRVREMKQQKMIDKIKIENILMRTLT